MMQEDDLISRNAVVDMMMSLIRTTKGSDFPFRVWEGLRDLPAIDAVRVVRCRNCQSCRLLSDGRSFECLEQEIEFYAPHYDAATYYCAEGKLKERGEE